VQATEYIFYCKMAILFLSSSKILTPHPPLHPVRMSSPRNKGRGYTLAGWTGGWGINILEDERNTGLPSYSKICTLWCRQLKTWDRSSAVPRTSNASLVVIQAARLAVQNDNSFTAVFAGRGDMMRLHAVCSKSLSLYAKTEKITCTNEFIPKDIWRIFGEGVVKEPNLTIAITPAPLKIIQYSVICTTVLYSGHSLYPDIQQSIKTL
jgi:hypothetical protein